MLPFQISFPVLVVLHVHYKSFRRYALYKMNRCTNMVRSLSQLNFSLPLSNVAFVCLKMRLSNFCKRGIEAATRGVL